MCMQKHSTKLKYKHHCDLPLPPLTDPLTDHPPGWLGGGLTTYGYCMSTLPAASAAAGGNVTSGSRIGGLTSWSLGSLLRPGIWYTSRDEVVIDPSSPKTSSMSAHTARKRKQQWNPRISAMHTNQVIICDFCDSMQLKFSTLKFFSPFLLDTTHKAEEMTTGCCFLFTISSIQGFLAGSYAIPVF